MILKGDCIEVMKAMKPNSVDAIVTDPPYGLEFMGKEWDKLWDKRKFGIDEYSKKSFTCSDGSTRKTNPVSRKLNNPNYKAGIEAQLWHTQWLIEAYRVLKPGGSMLVMGGTRTSHRLACAIEDSGFIIKDTIMWLYGSGFPKAQDLGKMIDKRGGQSLKRFGRLLKEARLKKGLSQKDVAKHFPSKTGGLTGCIWNWEEGINTPTVDEVNKLIDVLDLKEDKAFEAERKKIGIGTSGKTAIWNEKGEMGHFDITAPSTNLAKHWDGFKVGGIKPAYEPIIWAVKPPEGSYVDNVLKHGVGAVNVDETRIGINVDDKDFRTSAAKGEVWWTGITQRKVYNPHPLSLRHDSKGRFPANIILSHHPECVQVGMKRVKGLGGSGRASKKGHGFQTEYVAGDKKGEGFSGGFVDKNGFETVESWDCHPDCAVRMLDEQSGMLKSGARKGGDDFKLGRYKDQKGHWGIKKGGTCEANSGGASRFFYCAKASKSERNKGLDGLAIIDIIEVWKENNITREAKLAKLQVDTATLHARVIDESGMQNKSVLEWSMSWFGKNILGKYQKDVDPITKTATSSITISRILKYLTSLLTKEYTADVKLSKENGGSRAENVENSSQLIITISESLASRLGVRNAVSKTQLKISVKEKHCDHPTVKPIKLFEWLICLVTREGQIVLDPFIGSGTTIIAAHNTGRKCMGIEKEEEYLEIAKRRTVHWRSWPKQISLNYGEMR